MQNFANKLRYDPKFRLIVMISFCLSTFLLCVIRATDADTPSSSPSAPSVDDYEYVCIVDAGSTGSRIHVYKYRADDTRNSGLIAVDIKREKYEKFKPGLSSFESKANDDAAMSEYFEAILNFARDNVPLSKRAQTPLFVLASAGMRRVRERSKDTAQQIMDNVYRRLIASEFVVFREFIRIIEGRNEGLWGWIAANYLNGALSQLLLLSPAEIYAQHRTKGILEMGGESVQITFIPSSVHSAADGDGNDEDADMWQHMERVRIGHTEFSLFSYSWMGIGMEAAQNRLDSYLATVKQQREASPCYIRGDVRQRQHTIGQDIAWKGSGDFMACYSILTEIIDARLRSDCDVDAFEKYYMQMMCAPNGVLMPKIAAAWNTSGGGGGSASAAMTATSKSFSEFYYIENFYYTANVLGIADVNGEQFLNTLLEKGKYYCSLHVDAAKKQFPEASEEEIRKTCFCAAWLLAVINKGFDLQHFDQFKVIRDIEGEGSIDWALGFLVAEVPNMMQKHNVLMDVFGSDTFTFRFLLIVMAVLSVICCWQRKTFSNNVFVRKYNSFFYGGNKKENKNQHKYAYQRLNVL